MIDVGRECSKCHVWKPANLFDVRRDRTIPALAGVCRSCNSERRRARTRERLNMPPDTWHGRGRILVPYGDTKVCSSCRQELPIGQYTTFRDPLGRQRRKPLCKSCLSKRQRAYRARKLLESGGGRERPDEVGSSSFMRNPVGLARERGAAKTDTQVHPAITATRALTKVCTGCNRDLPRDAYETSSKHGRLYERAKCRTCISTQKRARHALAKSKAPVVLCGICATKRVSQAGRNCMSCTNALQRLQAEQRRSVAPRWTCPDCGTGVRANGARCADCSAVRTSQLGGHRDLVNPTTRARLARGQAWMLNGTCRQCTPPRKIIDGHLCYSHATGRARTFFRPDEQAVPAVAA